VRLAAATVEHTAPSVAPKNVIHLQLRQSDFTTSTRIVDAVNKSFPAPTPPARADDPV
jgi:flagellar basal body P-ring protein FlgI